MLVALWDVSCRDSPSKAKPNVITKVQATSCIPNICKRLNERLPDLLLPSNPPNQHSSVTANLHGSKRKTHVGLMVSKPAGPANTLQHTLKRRPKSRTHSLAVSAAVGIGELGEQHGLSCQPKSDRKPGHWASHIITHLNFPKALGKSVNQSAGCITMSRDLRFQAHMFTIALHGTRARKPSKRLTRCKSWAGDKHTQKGQSGKSIIQTGFPLHMYTRCEITL